MKKFFKKSIAAFMATIMIAALAVVGAPAQEVDAGGYTLIRTAGEFYNIRNNMSGSYKLAGDIDLSGYYQWTEIGTSLSKSFKGTLDGDGYTISGLSFGGKSETDYGIFGYTDRATIKNLNIVLSKGTSTSISSSRKGVLAGSLYNSTVDNVHIDGNGGTVQGVDYSGGLAGVLNGSEVRNSSVSNIKIVTRSSYAGGFIGAANSAAGTANKTNIMEENNVKDVEVTSGSTKAGGFVGYTYGSAGTTTYKDCHVENADVTAKSNDVGGFAGKVYKTHYFDSCTVTNINAKSTGGSYSGGFVGYSHGSGSQTQTMVDCRVIGANVYGERLVGGFAGQFGDKTSKTTIVNKAVSCYAIDVDVSTGKTGNFAGGWSGRTMRAAVSESCAMGSTIRATGYSVGGFTGELSYTATATDCYSEFESVTGLKWVGGFCGYFASSGVNTIKNTYGVAKVYATYRTPIAGAHTGFSSGGTFLGTNYYDNEVCSIGATGNTYKGSSIQGYDTATMMKQATFVGWDFVNIWRIDENITYPYFWKLARAVSAAPGINQGYAGDDSISGTGVPGAAITVTVDGDDYITIVNPDATWKVDVNAPLVKDQVATATQKEDDKRVSETSEMTIHEFDTTVRGVMYEAENLTSGNNSAVPGDKISVTGTAVAGSTRWMTASISISLANRVNIDTSTIIIDGNAAIAGYNYMYDASTQILTFYMGLINAGNTKDFSFEADITGTFGADLKDTIMDLTY